MFCFVFCFLFFLYVCSKVWQTQPCFYLFILLFITTVNFCLTELKHVSQLFCSAPCCFIHRLFWLSCFHQDGVSFSALIYHVIDIYQISCIQHFTHICQILLLSFKKPFQKFTIEFNKNPESLPLKKQFVYCSSLSSL